MGSKAKKSKGVKIPGLVDLQVNGCKGIDFSDSDLTRDDFVLACRGVLEAGTTAFLPTIITSAAEVYEHNLPIMASVLQSEEFRGRLLGIHVEGPFISAQDGARGAHNAEWTVKPDIAFLDKLIAWAEGKIRLLTISAELEGAQKLAHHTASLGIAVSLGHQMATEEDLRNLVRAGAVSLTHLGNGVPGLLPRHENPIWAGLANDDLVAMIITDGHHLPPSVLKTIIRVKGADRCVVVSDASFLAGLEAGTYEMSGEKVVLEEGGRLYNPETWYLAGSSLTMLECMNYLASLDLVGYDELVAMGFHNPLKLIGLGPEDIVQSGDICFDEEDKVFYIEK
ncbi:MAG: N-acetylglucosamine-6-phosphate deacetylase [Planctomycetota bacterium]|jgi:N-acetylglucosamine-6-phosphate deacetylase